MDDGAVEDAPAGVYMFKYKQSSDICVVSVPGLTTGSTSCQQSGPNCVASNLEGDHGVTGSGGDHRNDPTGGAA